LPKCHDEDYINFLIGAQRQFTCTEAARSQSDDDDETILNKVPLAAHDSFTRLLERLPQNSEALWDDARKIIRITEG
jgi:putative transposase